MNRRTNIYKAMHLMLVPLGAALHHAFALVALGRDTGDGFGVLVLSRRQRSDNGKPAGVGNKA